MGEDPVWGAASVGARGLGQLQVCWGVPHVPPKCRERDGDRDREMKTAPREIPQTLEKENQGV